MRTNFQEAKPCFFLTLKKLKDLILFERQTYIEKERDRERIFHALVHSPNAHNRIM